MANPQTADGFTVVASKYLEELAKANLSGAEYQIMLAVIRKTWGWKKKRDQISYGQLSELTGLPRRSVIRAIKRLVTKRTLVVTKRTPVICLELQKDYEKWLVTKRTLAKGSDQMDTKSGDQMDTHKRKEKIKERKRPNLLPEALPIAEHLFARIKENDSKMNQPNLENWATHIDRLIRLDNRSPEDIRRVIDWCQSDDFWRSNILCTEKLRKQFQALWLQMNSNGGRKQVRANDLSGIGAGFPGVDQSRA